MACVSFSLTKDYIFDSISTLQKPLAPLKLPQKHSWTATVWQFTKSQVVTRIIAVFASVFAVADTFIHLLSGIYKGSSLFLRKVFCLKVLDSSWLEITTHFENTIEFAVLSVAAVIANVLLPDCISVGLFPQFSSSTPKKQFSYKYYFPHSSYFPERKISVDPNVIKLEISDNVLNITNSEDTLCYLNNRSDHFIAKLKQKYNGLKEVERVNKLLQTQNYIEVLNYLWTEGDQNIRINWLEKKYAESHPILLFELAREYSIRDPSLETYILKSWPMIDMGKCRVSLDCACTSDKSVEAGIGFLAVSYINSILKLIRPRYSENQMQKFFKAHFMEFWTNKKNYIEEMLASFLDQKQLENMPLPSWIFSHGLSAFRGKMDEDAFSSSKWNKIREEAAKDALQILKEKDAVIMKDPIGYLENIYSFEQV